MLKQKIIILTMVLFIFVAPVFVFAETVVETTGITIETTNAPADVVAEIVSINAGITPGSFWYFFDKLAEKINLTLTFSSEKKAEKVLRQAEERLAELQELSDRNDFSDLEELLGEYEGKVEEARDRSEGLKDTEKSEKLLINIEERTVKHQEVLGKVLEQVPEQARETIQRVINENLERQKQLEEKVMELKKENEELRKKLREEKKEKNNSDDSDDEGDSDDSDDESDDNDDDEGDDSDDDEGDDSDNDDKKGDDAIGNSNQREGNNHINLYIEADGNEVKLNWYASGVDTSKGFKLIEGYGENPVYSDDNAVFVEGDKKSYEKTVEGGKILNYKLCSYTGTECVNYSNNVKVWIPKVKDGDEARNPTDN